MKNKEQLINALNIITELEVRVARHNTFKEDLDLMEVFNKLHEAAVLVNNFIKK